MRAPGDVLTKFLVVELLPRFRGHSTSRTNGVRFLGFSTEGGMYAGSRPGRGISIGFSATLTYV